MNTVFHKVVQSTQEFIANCIRSHEFPVAELFADFSRNLKDHLTLEIAFINRNLKIVHRQGFSASPYRIVADYQSPHPEVCLSSSRQLLLRQFKQKEPIIPSGKHRKIFHISFPLSVGGVQPQTIVVLKLSDTEELSEQIRSLLHHLISFLSAQVYFFESRSREDALFVKFISTLQKIILSTSNVLYEHCLRTSEHARTIGQVIRLNEVDMNHLIDAALIHDIGHVHIPREVFNKPGQLSDSEYDLIKKSVDIAYSLLRSPIFFELESIGKIIYSHMERVDGSGYPRGIKGNQISRVSRVLSIANAYDAMTSPRTYQKPLSARAALEELKRCAGLEFNSSLTRFSKPCKQFDTEIVKLFVNYLEKLKVL